MINVTDNCEDFELQFFNLLKYISLEKQLKLMYKGGIIEQELLQGKYKTLDITDICKQYNIEKHSIHIPEDENIYYIKKLLNILR